jgi:hypothetical protein
VRIGSIESYTLAHPMATTSCSKEQQSKELNCSFAIRRSREDFGVLQA